mgnify:CR=1 FL=1
MYNPKILKGQVCKTLMTIEHPGTLQKRVIAEFRSPPQAKNFRIWMQIMKNSPLVFGDLATRGGVFPRNACDERGDQLNSLN